jgi:hypothetical protein
MRSRHVLATVLVALLAASSAGADEADPRRVAARELAGQGDAMFAKGRCDRAIPLWSDANDQFHAPTLLLRIARCQALLGKVVQATDTLQTIVNEPADPDGPQAFADARAQATEELGGVRSRVASLEIDVTVPHDAPAAVVEVDDVPFVEGRAAPIDPGAHRVRVRLRDATWERAITLEDAETRRIPVTVFAEPPAPRHSLQRPIAYALGGAGIVALGIGTAFGVSSLKSSSTLTSECGSQRTNCPAGSQSQIDSLKSRALIADVAIGGGGALFLAGAITLLAIPAPKTEAPRFQIVAQGLGGRLVGTF